MTLQAIFCEDSTDTADSLPREHTSFIGSVHSYEWCAPNVTLVSASIGNKKQPHSHASVRYMILQQAMFIGKD